jgi:hypothetical protein
MSHREVMVKVNAPVDKGVAPLVVALSEDSCVQTIESCEGDEERPAFVIFRRGNWQECGSFLFDELLASMPDDLRADVSLSLAAYDDDLCHGRIALSPAAIDRLANLIRNARRSACSRDRKRTLPNNY